MAADDEDRLDDETASRRERAEADKMAREYVQIAMDAARTAAPFVHPRLTPTTPPEPEQQVSPLPPLQLIVSFEKGDPNKKQQGIA